MASFPRYAIYYVSAPGSALDRFGAELLGYDARSGEDVSFPDDVLHAVPDWHALTQDPRKYGFHATLKAPFPLAQGKSEAELLAVRDRFAIIGLERLAIDRIAVFCQDDSHSRFRILGEWKLRVLP